MQSPHASDSPFSGPCLRSFFGVIPFLAKDVTDMDSLAKDVTDMDSLAKDVTDMDSLLPRM